MARKEARMHRAPGRTRSEKTVMKTGIQGVGKRTDERRTRTARCCRARGWHKSDGEIAAAIFPLSIPNFRYLSLIFSIRSLLSSSHSVPRSSSAFSRAFHSPRSYQTVCTLRFLHLIRAIFSLPAHFSDTIFAIFFSLPLSLSHSLGLFFPFLLGAFLARLGSSFLLYSRASSTAQHARACVDYRVSAKGLSAPWDISITVGRRLFHENRTSL